uniref:Uncharacterized protein n=1 Tax=Anguilla anguilla TaxID=7936 RepID=A0A0E9XAY6_ANGAN
MVLQTVPSPGVAPSMASTRVGRTSTLLYCSRTKTTGCTWPLGLMMVALPKMYHPLFMSVYAH